MRVILILFGLFPMLLAAASSAAERDILEIAKEHPLRISVNGVPANYGDPQLAAAVDALVDIPRPWTVPAIIDVFGKESSAWLRKLQAQIDKKSEVMWEGWEKESKRCGHLATLLAASRDPRAALVLGKALDRPDFPGGIRVVEGLYNYFLPDPRYHQIHLEHHGPEASTNLYPEMTRRVRLWWTMNKEDLEASAKAEAK